MVRNPCPPSDGDEALRRLDEALGGVIEAAYFDLRLLPHLLRLLDERGFRHLSMALLRSAGDVAGGLSDRSEFDALADLALSLVAGQRRVGAPEDTPGPAG